MSSLRQLFSRSRTWLAVCAATIACNSIFDIEDPIERAAPDGSACLLNSSCPTGQVCLFQVCSPPCEADVDCASTGSRCLHTNDGTACVSESQATCDDDEARCPSGTVCSKGSCYAECEGIALCADGHACVGGICNGVPSNGTGGLSGASGAGGDGGRGGTSSVDGGASSGGEAGNAQAGEAVGGAGMGGEGGEGPRDVCVPKARTCQDNSVKTCNGDGSAYLPGLEPCEDEQTCVQGACEDHECTPSTDFCSGKTIRTCADNGLSSAERMTCGASQYCDPTTAQCKDGVCAPDQPSCNGNTATTCNAVGSGYVAGGTVCKATETCEAGACKPHVCTPSASFCQGQDVKKCAANGLSSTVDSTCTASKTCVPSGSTASCVGVCGPGQTNCSGNGVQACNASGQWGAVTACKTTETCSAGRCTACSGGLLNCDDSSANACETNPSSTSSCGSTCANVRACPAQHGTASCSSGACGISCSSGFRDCGGTNDGCETAVTADPNNCGNCGVACKYRSCANETCQFSTWGNDTTSATTTKLSKNMLWTFKINVAPTSASTTLLQALGIVVLVDGVNPAANIRIGLYSDSANAPNALEGQTSAFVTTNGRSERLLTSAASIPSGSHWIAFLADQDVRVHTDSATTSWASAPVTYASVTTLPATFPLPSAFTIERGHLFAVTTP